MSEPEIKCGTTESLIRYRDMIEKMLAHMVGNTEHVKDCYFDWVRQPNPFTDLPRVFLGDIESSTRDLKRQAQRYIAVLNEKIGERK